MLSAVFFRSNNVQYIIIYGLSAMEMGRQLKKMAIPSHTVFLYITETPTYALAREMFSNPACIGFGPDAGFVKATPQQCRSIDLAITQGPAYTLTIAPAVGHVMGFVMQEEAAFHDNLVAAMAELIQYVRNDEIQAEPVSVETQLLASDDHFTPSSHLSAHMLSYPEFLLTLNEASTKRLTEIHSKAAAEGEAKELQDVPIHCFTEMPDFERWFKELADDGEDEIASMVPTEIIAPEALPGSRKPMAPITVLSSVESQASPYTVESTGPATPKNTPLPVQEVGRKRRRLEDADLTQSFYVDPEDEQENMRL